MRVFALIRGHSPTLRLASLQFVSLAAVGMIAPYINLYLIEADFSPTLIGTLSSIGAILALTITPWLNHVADKHTLHRRLFMLYMLVFALGNTFFAISSNQVLLIIAVLLLNVSISPSITLGMQLTMTLAAKRSKSVLGQIRSFAALGFSAASLLAGRLFTWGGYPLLFWIGALFAILTIQVSTIFPAKSKIKEKRATTASTKRHTGFYVLLASQFFIMMGIRNSFAFTFIHLTENLGIATGNIGIWAAFLAGIEVPFFIFTDTFLPKIPSRFAYIFGIVGMATFIFLLGTTPSQFLLLLAILFRGIVWPILYLSSFTIVSEISHQHNIATNQAILQVTMPSVAILLTGSAFGWIFDHLGSFAFFTLCALMCMMGAGIMLVFHRLFDNKPAFESA